MNKKYSKLIVPLLGIVMLAAIAIFAIPQVEKVTKERKDNEINKTLESIYKQAVIVDEIEGGLHNDSDNKGKYSKLSKRVELDIYNAPRKNKYSLSKDYKSGKITVRYGNEGEYQYPYKKEDEEKVEIDKENVETQDLFTYDESLGRVVVTGFSETGVSLLKANSVIEIPASYNGRSVVEIADKAFYNKNIMGAVIIPESVSKVGQNSFSNNGEKSMSGNIGKPYAGTWKVEDKKWVKIN